MWRRRVWKKLKSDCGILWAGEDDLVGVLGFDVGGANTKAVAMQVQDGKVLSVEVAAEYFPVWKEPEKLADIILALRMRLNAHRLDAVGLTMTAELSDAYQTKREGVYQILRSTQQAIPNLPIYILSTSGKMETIEFAISEPLAVAAANWAATGWLVSQNIKDCVVVDVGSTSTSIIPVLNGKVVAVGKTDLDKLVCGELVYTGSLRSNVAAIVPSVPVKDGVAAVASELFALSGDVHLVLGNICMQDYNCETADGRGKTLPQALARLARVVCADTDMLKEHEIVEIAKHIHNSQVCQIAKALSTVYSRVKQQASGKVPVVVTGLGKNFLARKAAETINADCIVDLSELLRQEAVYATPAFGVALMTAQKQEGGEGCQ